MNIPTSFIACIVTTAYLAVGSLAFANFPDAQARRWAEEVHATARVSGGSIVRIGNIGERTAALRTSDRYYIQGLLSKLDDVRAARDAFNGSLLWKRDIPEWAHRIYPFKSGPARAPRRLVAVGDRVYTTLGITAPVSEIDAATGGVLRTEGTEEILVGHGYLIALAGGPPPKPYLPVLKRDGGTLVQNLGKERDRAILEGKWTEIEHVIVAVNLNDGSQRWQRRAKVGVRD